MESTAGDGYGYLRQLVYSVTQNVLDPSRDYLFDSRLAGILRDQGMTQVGELVRHLRRCKDPTIEQSIAEAMTINETSFFRDGHPFELLRTELLPRLIEARRQTRALRIWSAACSTGQEAYSLAMLLVAHFPRLAGWDIRIEGTDICSAAIKCAQAGRYHRIDVNRGLPARMLARFFDHQGESWTIKPEVRRLCRFRHANLCGTPFPFSRASDRFDIIFLRNVMLYFSQETRLALLEKMHHLLPPDGILFLGSSEQPPDTSAWKPEIAGSACHYKPRRTS